MKKYYYALRYVMKNFPTITYLPSSPIQPRYADGLNKSALFPQFKITNYVIKRCKKKINGVFTFESIRFTYVSRRLQQNRISLYSTFKKFNRLERDYSGSTSQATVHPRSSMAWV